MLITLETNIDNMNPELYGDLLTLLLDAGAKDAWLVPIIMKKGRPAVTLKVLLDKDLLSSVSKLIFTHTTAIGLRYSPVGRVTCQRQIVAYNIDGQVIHVKEASYEGQVVNKSLEYEDLKRAAKAWNLSVKLAEYKVRKYISW